LDGEDQENSRSEKSKKQQKELPEINRKGETSLRKTKGNILRKNCRYSRLTATV